MSAFEAWKASLPAGKGYSAEEAFNAGMTRAAEISLALYNEDSETSGRVIWNEILKARDTDDTAKPTTYHAIYYHGDMRIEISGDQVSISTDKEQGA